MKKYINKKNILISTSGLAIAVGLLFALKPTITEAPLAETEVKIPADEYVVPLVLKKNTTFFDSLRGQNIDPVIIQDIVQKTKPIYNLARLNSGTRFEVYLTKNEPHELRKINFLFTPEQRLEITKVQDQWSAQIIKENVEIKVIHFSGIVTSSLWESAEEAKMDPNLISDLTEIFAWQIDFSREVRPKDRWRLSVEQKFVNGKSIGYRNILAAEYENTGQIYTGILFEHENKNYGYFDSEGKSLRRMFLRSPIQYGRISSRFQRNRFHPILNERRPHLGVDYAAPKGTPIRAVGEGTVVFASYNGGGGHTIKVRHNSVYETAYKHLSGYAANVRVGSRVKQGQTIGYVGSTGLATGPHLHFEFYQNRRFVDPLGKKFPSADPVPPTLLTEFKVFVEKFSATLPPWPALDVAREIATDNKTSGI